MGNSVTIHEFHCHTAWRLTHQKFEIVLISLWSAQRILLRDDVETICVHFGPMQWRAMAIRSIIRLFIPISHVWYEFSDPVGGNTLQAWARKATIFYYMKWPILNENFDRV